MSLVYITTHGESIYDCAEKEPEKVLKPAKYVSIHRKRLKSETKAILSSHKTMGYSETPLKSPCEFLRKNSGVKYFKIPAHICEEEKPPLPPVPKRYEQGKFKREPKDFKTMNIQTARESTPKKPIQKLVSTRDGLTYMLYGSGLTPYYICSEKYGKVPRYLNAMKRCLNECYKEKVETKHMPEESLPKGIRALSSNEIREIILGLKKNWMDLTQKFNALPVFIDTVPKQKRKHKMEHKLREIEQDILLLEKNPVIYVCEDI
ncbi:enkurin-like [Condylostylus longicornis]|uniref:enkurin-like n=1 Tax=Condylostylus longicornis TaxID=2530218 RepID=UPI00244DD776|nr:enkurin-like [Condylostylus longicornis]